MGMTVIRFAVRLTVRMAVRRASIWRWSNLIVWVWFIIIGIIMIEIDLRLVIWIAGMSWWTGSSMMTCSTATDARMIMLCQIGTKIISRFSSDIVADFAVACGVTARGMMAKVIIETIKRTIFVSSLIESFCRSLLNNSGSVRIVGCWWFVVSNTVVVAVRSSWRSNGVGRRIYMIMRLSTISSRFRGIPMSCFRSIVVCYWTWVAFCWGICTVCWALSRVRVFMRLVV